MGTYLEINEKQECVLGANKIKVMSQDFCYFSIDAQNAEM